MEGSAVHGELGNVTSAPIAGLRGSHAGGIDLRDLDVSKWQLRGGTTAATGLYTNLYLEAIWAGFYRWSNTSSRRSGVAG